MVNILGISGSPSATSRTAMLVKHIVDQFADQASTDFLRLNELDKEALFDAHPVACVTDAIAKVEWADSIVVGTPIYKASYSGLLKSFFDILPQYALVGKAVLPVATGGSIAHLLAMDYALRPVLQSMGPRQVIQSFFLHSDCPFDGKDGLVLGAKNLVLLNEAIRHFRSAAIPASTDRLLGHPMPERTARELQ